MTNTDKTVSAERLEDARVRFIGAKARVDDEGMVDVPGDYLDEGIAAFTELLASRTQEPAEPFAYTTPNIVEGFSDPRTIVGSIWPKRTAGEYATVPIYLTPPAPGRSKEEATADFRCPECGCRSYAPVDERKPDGSFAPGDLARCVHCKSVSKAPALGPASLHKGEDEPVATMHVSDTEVLFSKGWTGKGLMGFRSSPLYASPAPLPVGVTDAAEARIKALEEALRPFAFEGLHTDIERFDDETHIEVHFPRTNPRKATPVSWVYVEDVLRARATLNSGEKADG